MPIWRQSEKPGTRPWRSPKDRREGAFLAISPSYWQGSTAPGASLRHLFGQSKAEVPRMSSSELMEDEVEGIRSGAIPDPTVQQVAALMAVFGLEPSYLVNRKEPPSLDAELLEGFSEETTREMSRQALRPPERERVIVHGIVRRLGE
jgi:hypothetical protein